MSLPWQLTDQQQQPPPAVCTISIAMRPPAVCGEQRVARSDSRQTHSWRAFCVRPEQIFARSRMPRTKSEMKL
ncbi:unnamed protein product [Ceratitis capitata]|uniref:(Mediterranean fruit fly) hypothetical protein n=1 Tax=Ceratitis capitata TaxID=7213 RepID=A0A811TXK8_CERCA|nr:unnamed protein product [Ceratitis capitata]